MKLTAQYYYSIGDIRTLRYMPEPPGYLGQAGHAGQPCCSQTQPRTGELISLDC
jgi:hypothetical protein